MIWLKKTKETQNFNNQNDSNFWDLNCKKLGLLSYSDIDSMEREADTAKEGEGSAVGIVEGEEGVEIRDFCVFVVKQDTILLLLLLLLFAFALLILVAVCHGWAPRDRATSLYKGL